MMLFIEISEDFCRACAQDHQYAYC